MEIIIIGIVVLGLIAAIFGIGIAFFNLRVARKLESCEPTALYKINLNSSKVGLYGWASAFCGWLACLIITLSVKLV